MSDAPSLTTLLEATLFGAGRSLKQSELAEQFGVSESTLRMELLDLQQTITDREGSPIQLTEINRYWVLEVKPQLSNHIPKIARTEIPKRLLRAAALIAYHQPMKQNRLVEMLGQVAYEHVGDLRELGLIDKRHDGNTRRLTTTRRFSEYFGCPHTATKDVATWFQDQARELGLTGSQLADVLSGGEVGDAEEESEATEASEGAEESEEAAESTEAMEEESGRDGIVEMATDAEEENETAEVE
uniref:Putative transcriptional regulator (ScpB) n=3 Tax=environmental samples TaxID=68359 RepID=A0A075FQ65_9EURY|nr:putative transcriptional regulator (scpB) [uncultured marine group II/III euryarchaeote AD1000_34_D01]AIE98325.1 putative transcriptional regulator (scpB) [uncultured marine group II/III euryarchaeote KM3_05_F04]AIF20140.1 putative transcriptional regulator (scpB) [uncultured marine group II/III euryarchaeote KM3_88_E02]